MYFYPEGVAKSIDYIFVLKGVTHLCLVRLAKSEKNILREQKQIIYLAQTISPTVCFLCSSSKEQKMASKRSTKEDTVEDLAKRIKLEQKKISEKINKDYPDMGITEHEISKFIFIFHTLLKTSLNKDKF